MLGSGSQEKTTEQKYLGHCLGFRASFPKSFIIKDCHRGCCKSRVPVRVPPIIGHYRATAAPVFQPGSLSANPCAPGPEEHQQLPEKLRVRAKGPKDPIIRYLGLG